MTTATALPAPISALKKRILTASDAELAAARQPFPLDAALTYNPQLPYDGSTKSWGATAFDWDAKIAREQLIDYGFEVGSEIAWRELFLDPRDGALLRDPRGRGFAYTPHAWGQLIGLLLTGVENRPSGAAGPYNWLFPRARAHAFENCVTRAVRPPDNTMVLRTFLHQPQAQPNGTVPPPVRALRAVVSQRHAGKFYDDLALMEHLDAEIGVGARSYVARSLNETRGWAELEHEQNGLRAVLHWHNSETGCASLSFHGGATIRFLDTQVVSTKATELDVAEERRIETRVEVSSARSGARASHTMRRAGLNDIQRAAIATERMALMVAKARAAADELCVQWGEALKDLAPIHASNATNWEVLLDFVEEKRGIEGEDRVAMLKVLTDDARLTQVPHGSAAHVACVYALLAKQAKTYSEAMRLQAQAGLWLEKGWK